MSARTVESLQQIVERANLLLQNDFAYLSSYWNGASGGFHANEDSIKAGKINVTTTCFCLFAILPNAHLVSQFSAMSPDTSDSILTQVAKTLLATPWKSEDLNENNIYTTPIVVRTLYRLLEAPGQKSAMQSILDEKGNKNKLTLGVEAILKETTKGAAYFEPYDASAYLTYWSFRALRSEVNNKLLNAGLTERCAARIAEFRKWAEAEVYRQIAYDAAEDATSFDATQLAYALRMYAQSFTDEAKPLNQKVIAKALEVIGSHQMRDGLWPKSHPIFHYRTRGNVYTFTFELLDVVLARVLPAGLFLNHINRLEASLRWVEQNKLETAQTKGWRSNHLPFGVQPEAWSTAAVLISVRKIRDVFNYHLNAEVLNQFKAQRFARPDGTPFAEDKFYDCEVPNASPSSLKALLQKYLIAAHSDEKLKTNRRYSAVFFGPPGTAKTTLAEAVARCLGWPYIYLQTSDFAGEGVSQVIGKTREVFTRLSLLERAVILFDEVEEFVRDRTEKRSSPESRMITTSMLSLIQELRRQKRVIFIVATNFLDKFDAAITRSGGRFDLMILVAPPTRSEKQRMFRDALQKSHKLNGQANVLCPAFEAFVNQNYETEIQYFAFSEWSSFIEDILRDLEAAPNVPNDDQLKELLNKHLEIHKTGIAIRDQLRSAYNASKKFVRVS